MLRFSLSFVMLLLPVLALLSGQSHAQKIDSILATSPDTLQVELLSDLISEMVDNGDIVPDELFEKVIALAQEMKSPWGLALLYLNRSIYAMNTSYVKKAYTYVEKAIYYGKLTNEPEWVSEAYSVKIQLLVSDNAIEKATKLALYLIKEYETAGNFYYVSNTYQSLAAITTRIGNYELTTKYHKEAINFAQKSGWIDMEIAAYNTIADNLQQLGHPKESLQYAEKALFLSDEYDLPASKWNALSARAAANTDLGNYDAALKDYELLDKWQGDQHFTWLMASKGILLQRLGKHDEARELLLETINIIKETSNDHQELMRCYKALQTVGLDQEAFDNVTRYSKLMTAHQDSIQREKNNRNLQRFQEHYKSLAKETKIHIQEKNLAAQQKQIYAGLMILFLLLVGGFLLNNQRSKLKKRNVENVQLIADKEALIREIHHRVKNNLQVISSLLEIQARGLDSNDDKGREALMESQGRVTAMGLIHNKLYQGSKVAAVFMPDYLQDLGDTLLDAYRLEEQVEIFYDVADISLEVENAISLGLIINELVTNSLKYAFPRNREGIIEMALYREQDQVRLTIIDNGVGVAAAEKRADSTSYGTSLIQLLTEKLKGSKRILPGSGHGVEIVFPK